ncbi:MAG: hypothetical protein V5B31_12985 [Candidatus Accumulibacter propinquus]|uniref:hypothetical protein n=1 Tax=Candidatus Accumulibacter propinquus TaxID=2954380 RepID=UPI002FC2815B
MTVSRFTGDKLAEARERIDELFGEQNGSELQPDVIADDADAAKVDYGRRLRVEAGALIEKAERLLANAGSEDAEDLVNAVEAVKDCMAGADVDLKTAMDTLADLLYYLDA